MPRTTHAPFTDDATNLTGASPPVIPLAKLGKGNSIAVRSAGGLNYFEVGTWGGTTGAATLAAGLTPTEAYAIDLQSSS